MAILGVIVCDSAEDPDSLRLGGAASQSWFRTGSTVDAIGVYGEDMSNNSATTLTGKNLVVAPDDMGRIVTITLDRPDIRNSLGRDVMDELTDAIHEVGHTNALGIVIAANGPVFSAGHNFGDMVGASYDQARDLLYACTRMMNAVQEAPQVVIAKVHALATAAGCQLVASCDMAIAGESAAFALPGGKGGLFCHTPLIAVTRQIGRKRALEMAITGDPIDAATAADWGLINKVVPDAELDAAVDDLMARSIRGSASSKALGKQAFYAQVDMDQPKAYDYAVQVMAAGVATPDAQEGITAFLDKRKPNFPPRL